MAAKGLIVIRNPGLHIPDPYMQRITKHYQTCGGAALVAPKGKGKLVDVLKYNKGGIGATTIKRILETFPDTRIAFHFVHSDTKMLDEDIQPFTILKNKDGKPTLVAMAEGQFPGYVGADSAHTQEHNFVHKMLMPRLAKLDAQFKGELDKIMPDLAEVKEDLGNHIGARGALMLIGSNGRIDIWSQGADYGEFEWGQVSNTMGYKEGSFPAAQAAEADEEPDAEEPSLASLVEGVEAEAEEPEEEEPDASEVEVQPEAEPAAAPAPAAPAKPTGVPAIAADQSYEWVEIPKHFDRKARKNFIKGCTHHKLPQPGAASRDFKPEGKGWEEATHVRRKIRAGIVDLPKVMPQQPAVVADTGTPKPAPAAVPQKVAAQPTVETKTSAAAGPLMMDEPTRDAIVNSMTSGAMSKFMDINGELAFDPKSLGEMEKQLPQFHEQLGLTWDEVLKMSSKAIEAMVNDPKTVKGVIALIATFRLNELKRLAAEGKTSLRAAETAKKQVSM